jgi:dynein heavy chain 1
MNNTLSRMKQDLEKLNLSSGKGVISNWQKEILSCLGRGEVPPQWLYKSSRLSPIAFISNMVGRYEQLLKISKSGYSNPVWIGGLFDPEAYLTATRQLAAVELGISLERLVLSATLTANKGPFIVSGLEIQGACWKNEILHLDDDILYSPLPHVSLEWSIQPNSKAKIPVYSNSNKHETPLFYISSNLKQEDIVLGAISCCVD